MCDDLRDRGVLRGRAGPGVRGGVPGGLHLRGRADAVHPPGRVRGLRGVRAGVPGGGDLLRGRSAGAVAGVRRGEREVLRRTASRPRRAARLARRCRQARRRRRGHPVRGCPAAAGIDTRGRAVPALGRAPAPRNLEEAVMTVIIYGDFNCPYSYLASQRAGRLRAAGVAVDWRAVEHDRRLPAGGLPSGSDQASWDRELAEVASLALPGEQVPVLPAMISNTEAAVAAYAEAVSDGIADE